MKMLKEIKHLFMTYRNGIVADTFHKAGDPHSVIFGLQLPQISEIARNIKDKAKKEELRDLAVTLWNDSKVRESRLLACYLFNTDDIDILTAEKMAGEILTGEEADILCFRLLQYLPFCSELCYKLKSCKEISKQRVAKSLDRFLNSE